MISFANRHPLDNSQPEELLEFDLSDVPAQAIVIGASLHYTHRVENRTGGYLPQPINITVER